MYMMVVEPAAKLFGTPERFYGKMQDVLEKGQIVSVIFASVDGRYFNLEDGGWISAKKVRPLPGWEVDLLREMGHPDLVSKQGLLKKIVVLFRQIFS